MIPYGRQDITQQDIDAVVDVLKSDYLTQGPKVAEFENKISEFCGAKFSVAFNSATSALHIACRALGLSSGDLLWTSPITFVASANCALYCGADVDFVDIDLKSYNMDIESLEAKLKRAQKQNSLPKVVIPVHFAGQSCDMKKIYDLSREYGFKIIEDASHAIGGKYYNEYIGGCKYSDITIFSFHPVKIVTTGEGGVALTNKYELSEKMQLLRSHGITRDSNLMTKTPDGMWYYQQIDLGYNYRLTDIQAALGISQLDRLDEYVRRRHLVAKRYDELLSNLPLITPWQSNNTYSSYHLYVIRLDLGHIQKSHKEVFQQLRMRDIGVNLHYIPVHLQPFYKEKGFNKGDFINAELYYSQALSIPIYPTLSEKDQLYIIKNLEEVLKT